MKSLRFALPVAQWAHCLVYGIMCRMMSKVPKSGR